MLLFVLGWLQDSADEFGGNLDLNKPPHPHYLAYREEFPSLLCIDANTSVGFKLTYYCEHRSLGVCKLLFLFLFLLLLFWRHFAKNVSS